MKIPEDLNNKCREAECKLWSANPFVVNCGLKIELEIECDKIGHYFQPKPQDISATYRYVRPFSALDLAEAGVTHWKIRDLHIELEACLNSGDTRDLDQTLGVTEGLVHEWIVDAMGRMEILSELDDHDFIKRVESKKKQIKGA